MVVEGSMIDGKDAELIRVGPGECSGARRSDRGARVLVVVDGLGSALSGDVWLEVGPGDRIEVDPGEPCALRAGDGGRVVGVLLARDAVTAHAA